MQQIIFEKPYQFIPPIRNDWLPNLIQRFNLYGLYLKKKEGVVTHELRHPERLKASLDENCGILLAPNHSRTSDPLVIGFLAREVDCHVYSMASWHLFNQGWFNAWAIRAMGGFSIYREGMDRKAINTAIEAMVEAKRPLVIFPEGATSRTNDHLRPLLDGVAMVAMVVDRVAAVDVLPILAGDEFVLRVDRAAGVAQREALVQPLHLLQEDEVRIERAQPVAQLVDHQAPVELRQALVNVQGDDAQRLAHGPRSPRMWIASRLDQLKQRCAASRQGSHANATCSSAASDTGAGEGSAKPNTCSVLCVTPGAKRCRQWR
jgi:hypothetical protein